MSATQKILRCLMLTTSTNDHESLAAIRKANQLLAIHKLSWEQYLGVAKQMDIDDPPPEPEFEPDPPEPKKRMSGYERTADMLATVKAHLQEHGSPAIDFIESLENGFLRFGSLTEKQMIALKKFYKNATRARAPF